MKSNSVSKRKSKILLVFPSRFYYPTSSERVEVKTSLLLLASYLGRYFDIEYADFEISIGRPNTLIQVKRFERKVMEFLSGREFDILGISCWTSLSYRASVTTARICRELYPDRVIAVGGYHPSARPHEFEIPEQLFDYVVIGEGEHVLKEIADNVQTSGRPCGTQIVSAPPFLREDFVGYEWSHVDRFVGENFGGQLKNAYVVLSRGCPFRCSFCMEPLKDRKWRAYDPATAIKEIEKVVDLYAPQCIPISDACFGMRPTWRKEFLRDLVAMNPDCLLILETRTEYLDSEDIELLSKLNVEVQLGIESCSPEVLLLMKKTRQPDKYLSRFREVSHIMSDQSVIHRASLIFNHPGETKKTLAETFSFIDSEISRGQTSLIWANHGYMHFPGCSNDTDRLFFEQKYGSKFLSGPWWQEEADQYENSLMFVPSTELDGDDRLIWQTMIDERYEQFKAALTDEAFNYAAGKYFPNWQEDPRYRQD